MEKIKIEKAFSYAFWGMLLLIFNININGINILPGFIGYIMLLMTLDTFVAKRKELIDTLCIACIGINALDWIDNIFNLLGDGLISVLFNYLARFAAIAFMVLYLTEVIRFLREDMNYDEEGAKLQSYRDILFIGELIALLPLGVITLIVVVVCLIVLIMICVLFYQIKKRVTEELRNGEY